MRRIACLVVRLALGFVSGCDGGTLVAPDAATGERADASVSGSASDGAPDTLASVDAASAAPDHSFAPEPVEGGSGDGVALTDAGAPISWDGRAPLAHRDAGVVCSHERSDDAGLPCGDSGIPLPGNPCVVDSDCAAGRDGLCLCAPDLIPPAAGTGPGILYKETFCSYDACFVDPDCGSRVPCDCRGPIAGAPNVCLSASNCAVDSDCAPPSFCSPSPVFGQTPDMGFFCHTPADTCVDDVDCQPPPGPYTSACRFDTTSGIWRCYVAAMLR